MKREDFGEAENAASINPSSFSRSRPSVQGSNSNDELRITPDDVLDFIGYGPFQVSNTTWKGVC